MELNRHTDKYFYSSKIKLNQKGYPKYSYIWIPFFVFLIFHGKLKVNEEYH